MTLRFEWDWEPATTVRAPELNATWASLRIDVGAVTATLVEQRDGSGSVRRRIDVPTYPLAEWIAFNWWSLTTAASRARRTPSLADAGDGFAWPDLRLQFGPGYVLSELRRVDRAPHSIRYLSSSEDLLEPSVVQFELSRFIESTIDRLDEAGIHGTPLQAEWRAVSSADTDESNFCRTAVALGLDPYDLSEDQSELILGLGAQIDDMSLVEELAANTELGDLDSARAWIVAALDEVTEASPPPTVYPPFQALPHGQVTRPWLVGWLRAQSFREQLGLAPDDRINVESLVEIVTVQRSTPVHIAGLAQPKDAGTVLAVPVMTTHRSRRFAAARALGRRTFDDRHGGMLLSTRHQYADRVERAFAAELLAPAAGLRDFLDRDRSEEAMERAADHYGVSMTVVERQQENQLD